MLRVITVWRNTIHIDQHFVVEESAFSEAMHWVPTISLRNKKHIYQQFVVENSSLCTEYPDFHGEIRNSSNNI